MAKRRYTGWDGNASGKRAGMEEFVKLTSKHFDGGVWNNGSWGVRNMNSPGRSKPSVHGTGRAADMSWRKIPGNRRAANGFGNYKKALEVVDFWLANADLFLIEELHDYYPSPFGRGWRCNRAAWKKYQKQTIGNAPGGDWFHVEIAPAHADDAAYYRQAFARATGKRLPKPPKPDDRVLDELVAPSGRPELTKADEATVKPRVKTLQRILIAEGWAVFATADGQYGNRTFRSVKAMQGDLGFSGKKVDGRYGPNTANKLTTHLAKG
jgi:hypothetical protein